MKKKKILLLLSCLFFVVEPMQVHAGFLKGAFGKLMAGKLDIEMEAPEVVYKEGIISTFFINGETYEGVTILEIRGKYDSYGNIHKTCLTIDVKKKQSDGEYVTEEFLIFRKGRSFYIEESDGGIEKDVYSIASLDGYWCVISKISKVQCIRIFNATAFEKGGVDQVQRDELKMKIFGLAKADVIHPMFERAKSSGILKQKN